MLHIFFNKCTFLFPIVPVVKLVKIWVLLENYAHIKKETIDIFN